MHDNDKSMITRSTLYKNTTASKVLVSVIVPTYNRAHSLGRSIYSILKQTHEYFELIIIDDSSNDGTESVVTSFNDERIKYIRHNENKGAAAARNTGCKLALGTWLTFLDSDDQWEAQYLESQLAVAETSGCEAVASRFLFKRGDSSHTIPIHTPNLSTKESALMSILIENFITPQTLIIRRETYEKLGGFDENLRCIEDFEFALRLASSFSIQLNNKCLATVQLSPDSISSHWKQHYETMFKIWEKNTNLLNTNRLKERYWYFVGVCCLKNERQLNMNSFRKMIGFRKFSSRPIALLYNLLKCRLHPQK